MATRIIICKNDSMVCLLPDWITDLNLAHRIAKWMGFDDELKNKQNGRVNFRAEFIYMSTDREIAKILIELLEK